MTEPSLSELPPALVTVRPMVLLSGFLGAGKTTFLRNCLELLNERGLRMDMILNDRENAELDCETLVDKAASVAPLAGSCVCCDGLKDLTELALAASRSKHDALFIELNGTADPVPLIETFTLLESRFKMRPRWQVCVIDCRHFGTRGSFQDLENLQLETASHFYLSHSDEIPKQQLDSIRSALRGINAFASETEPLAFVEALSTALKQTRNVAIASAVSPVRTVPSFSAPKIRDERHRLAHEFTGCQILFEEPQQREDVLSWMADLPDAVIRAKALTRTSGYVHARFLFERVGAEVSPEPLEVPISDRVPASAILIGADLNPPALLESARSKLGATCHLG